VQLSVWVSGVVRVVIVGYRVDMVVKIKSDNPYMSACNGCCV
jgi:hypothetical protein